MKRKKVSEFGARLTAWREYLGLSKTELATRAGMTGAAIVMLESGANQRPKVENEPRIFGALGVTHSQFWGPVPSRPEAA